MLPAFKPSFDCRLLFVYYNIQDGKLEPLLKKYASVLVPSERIRASITAAKKSEKPAYTLAYNLALGVFGVEEMANSRGQGLSKPKGQDNRPVLDPVKCAALKGTVVNCIHVI